MCGDTNWRAVVGSNIRRFRKQRRYSQRTLAALSGLDLRGFGVIERGEGNPSLDTLARIAGALGVSPGALFDVGRHEAQ
jgi:transcriptional regulator with XRE-family HTH domain